MLNRVTQALRDKTMTVRPKPLPAAHAQKDLLEGVTSLVTVRDCE